MSWLKSAVEFGFGFLEGYAQSRAERHEHQQGFADFMAYLSRETRYTAVSINQASATFTAAVGRNSYPIVVLLKGDDVLLSVVSLITFPRDRAPRSVCNYLKSRNRELPHCDYDLLEGDDGDKFFVKCKVRAPALTPALFEAAIDELLPLVVGLDRFLLEQGYAH